MTSCEQLSERMPPVAAGREVWTEAEVAHLAGCAECRAEWALVQSAQRLAADASPAAPEAMTARVLQRVELARADDRRRAARRAMAWVALATAAVLAFAVLVRQPARTAPQVAVAPAPESANVESVPGGAAPPPSRVRLEVPLPELDDARPDELQAVLDGLDAALDDASPTDAPLTDEPTSQDLDRALRAWEG